MPTFDTIAFDADDALWHSERYYARTQAEFTKLLALYRFGSTTQCPRSGKTKKAL